jgi:predicted ATPase
MKIKSIHISNFKSIVNINIDYPNPFSVFVGPNASGKSNVFDALEFFNLLSKTSHHEVVRLFYGSENIRHRKFNKQTVDFLIDFEKFESNVYFTPPEKNNSGFSTGSSNFLNITENEFKSSPQNSLKYFIEEEYVQFFNNFFRIFIRNNDIEKIHFKDDSRLSLACGNLEKVLRRILKIENKRKEIIEWLQLLIPGFENIEIQSSELSGTDSLLIYEKGFTKPFTKNLISDGTYNILSILTAVYQTDEPQFLCIEEPENGINPKVVRELVNLFREKTEQGHYIWLNTHSQTLVSTLKEEEILIVEKVDGETRIKQIQKGKNYGLKMDEAWLTNVLGGGNPW